MFKKLVFLLLSMVLVSCKDEAPPITFEPYNFTETELSLCENEPCPKLELAYLQAKGTEQLTRNINNTLRQLVIETLTYDSIISPGFTIKDAASQFAQEFKRFKNDFPDSAISYKAETNVEVLYQDDQLINLGFNGYTYTGGAHGYGYRKSVNFDVQTGEELSINDLFTDLGKVTAFAKAQFLKKHGFAPDTPLKETGFWFEEDQFYLPDNMEVRADSILFTYNQYEIASYAEGPQTLVLARDDLNEFWRIK